MKIDNISAGRIVGCHPVVLDRTAKLYERLSFQIMVVQGKRTFNLQQALFMRGRNSLEIVNAAYLAVGLAPLNEELNRIKVTNARPGYGWHEYGLAIDVAPDDEYKAGFQLDWDVSHPAWKKMLEAAKDVGFAEGAEWRTFPDNPHLYPHELPATPGDDVRYAWKESGLMGVWKYLSDTKVLSLEGVNL